MEAGPAGGEAGPADWIGDHLTERQKVGGSVCVSITATDIKTQLKERRQEKRSKVCFC